MFFTFGAGGLFATAFVLIYMSAAFMDRGSDREAWQLWLGMSAGLSAASIAVGVVLGVMRKRTRNVWWVPAVLLVLPVTLVAMFGGSASEPATVGPPPLDLPLNIVPDAGIFDGS